MENKVVQNMSVERLVCRPQVRERFDEESLTGLAQTLKETGVLQPLLVRREGSEFVVVEGERRLRAAKLAKLAQVPVIIDDRELCEAEVVYRQLVVNCSREQLEPLEKARAIDRLMETAGLSASQVAVKLGMSPGMVSKLLALLSLPDTIQEQVASGALPVTTAYELSHADDAGCQLELAEQAANGGLTREAVVERRKQRKSNRRSGLKRQQSNVKRNRVNIVLGGGRSVAIAGPSLTISAMIDWLGELLERLRGVQGQSVEVSEAIKLIGSQA